MSSTRATRKLRGATALVVRFLCRVTYALLRWCPPGFETDVAIGAAMIFDIAFSVLLPEHRQLRPRVKTHYESMLERLILPELGDMKIVTLTPARVGCDEIVCRNMSKLQSQMTSNRANIYSVVFNGEINPIYLRL
jgi:hypothetical protein